MNLGFRACAGDIVLGMEDGIASIVGLIFGVAATGDRHAVLIAGCTSCVSAAVSMMAGVYMEAETEKDVGEDSAPAWLRALWMLLTDFAAAAVPIMPFTLLPVSEARWVAGGMTMALLTALGLWRAVLGARGKWRTVIETNAIGIGAASAGVIVAALLG